VRRHAGLAIGRLRARRAALRPGVEIGAGVVLGARVNVWCSPGGRIVIGDGVVILGHSTISAEPDALAAVGAGTFIGGYTMIAAKEHVTIGRECMLAEMIAIRDHDHDPAHPPLSGGMLVAPITVGDRVWIAAKASVGRGVTIGDDAVIAAHAFVSQSVPPDALAGGVPARVIRRDIKTR
jgi:acetyltransferase-like isoleucine patch superfamily enzyme